MAPKPPCSRRSRGRKPSVLSEVSHRGGNDLGRGKKRGALKAGQEIVEPTSGNTGIALAFVAAARGYKITLTMPENDCRWKRRRVLAAFGANLVLTPGPEGMKGAIKKATEIYESDKKHYFLPQQFDNPANPAIHESTTGPENLEMTPTALLMFFVSGVGTGGTITGVSRYIKKKRRGKKILSVAVEPVASPVITQNAGGAAAGAWSAQDSGHRRGFCAEEPGTGSDRPRRTGDQRGVRRDGASAHSRRGHPLRDFLRRRCGCVGALGEAAGICGQKPLSPCCPIRASATSRQSCSRGLAKQPEPGSACRVGQGSSLSAPLSQHCAPKRIVNSYDNTE